MIEFPGLIALLVLMNSNGLRFATFCTYHYFYHDELLFDATLLWNKSCNCHETLCKKPPVTRLHQQLPGLMTGSTTGRHLTSHQSFTSSPVTLFTRHSPTISPATNHSAVQHVKPVTSPAANHSAAPETRHLNPPTSLPTIQHFPTNQQ